MTQRQIKSLVETYIYIYIFKLINLISLMYNVTKWSDTLLARSCSIYSKVCKVCLTILRNFIIQTKEFLKAVKRF